MSCSEFVYLYRKLFPRIFDLKVCMRWESSLQNLMNQTDIPRLGESHQAGSDALGTVGTFIALGGGQAIGNMKSSEYFNR